MKLATLVVLKSKHIAQLTVHFDLLHVSVPQEKNVNQVVSQTRQAMAALMAAVNGKAFGNSLQVFGPGYGLFDRKGWQLLMEKVKRNALYLASCSLGDDSCHELAAAIKHDAQLTTLMLWENRMTEAGIYSLVEVLTTNMTID